MIDSVNPGCLDIGQCMWCCFYRPVDITNQWRIGTYMYNTAENTEVGLRQLIYSANKVYRLKAGKAVDKVSPVKTFPRFYLFIAVG